MDSFNEWRGYNILKRREKIERAVNLLDIWSAEDFPVVINSPCY